jgi:hypothetical protein
MGLEDQEAVRQVVAAQGSTDLVVILGSPDPESAELFAETLREGDPTWAGPLAGVPLGLSSYHMTEPEIRAAVDPGVYGSQVELMEMVLDVGPIWGRLAAVRAGQPIERAGLRFTLDPSKDSA